MTRLTIATATSMMFMGSRSWLAAIVHTDGGFSLVIWFGPLRARRAADSADVRPFNASEETAATTCAASCAKGGGPAG
jgi:hypothetical protein